METLKREQRRTERRNGMETQAAARKKTPMRSHAADLVFRWRIYCLIFSEARTLTHSFPHYCTSAHSRLAANQFSV